MSEEKTVPTKTDIARLRELAQEALEEAIVIVDRTSEESLDTTAKNARISE